MNIEKALKGDEGWPHKECRSCGAEIIWARTKNDKAVPMDAEPILSGRWVLEPGDSPEVPYARYIGDSRYTGQRHESHFATCPNAAQHSRSKKR